METEQEEQARHMAKLQNRADHMQQENDRLRARLDDDRGENARGSNHPASLVKQNKGKEPILSSESDAAAGDELSSGSSLLPGLSPPKNNVEAESIKRPHAVPAIPSVAYIVEYEENSAESDSQSRPSKMCPRGTRA